MSYKQSKDLQSICRYVEYVRDTLNRKSNSLNSSWCKLQPMATEERWGYDSVKETDLDPVFQELFDSMDELANVFTVLESKITDYINHQYR